MDPQDMPEANRLEELLGRYVEQKIVQGVTAEPETLCRDDPELLEPLRQCIQEYEQLDQVLAPPQALAPGRHLLHYRIVQKIGEGGMGQVYVAEDQKLGRRVALKVLPAAMAGDPDRRERFRREARAVAALNHPNIVTLHSIEETEGVHFLTMELVDGVTLTERIPPVGMALTELFNLAIPVADALAAAHERNITHRDLKPDNVMVDDRGRIKILDFGLAKLIHGPAGGDTVTLTATLTEAGHILGTVPYMSPEQILGKPADARSDIFSLGVMLYQMATGRRPFQGEAQAEVISAILRDTPSSVDELRGELPHHLGRIVRHCLEKDPEHRYQSALDVRNELADLKREVDSGEVAGSPVTASTATGAARRRPGGRKWWLAATAAAMILAVAAGYFHLRSREEAVGVTPPVVGTAAVEGTPSRSRIAVLYFENLTGDPQLDWLRNGITTMLVTDLSHSPDLDILSTGRLYQILKDLDALDESILSSDLVRGLAERAAVETVVRGSYARAGEVLRIAFTIEDATSGEILKTHSVDERGDERLFAMVDELSAAIRNTFEVKRPVESPATVQAATTTSLEAWRYYLEGIALYRQSKRPEAIALLEKAVELDPSFALALADLGRMHGNLAHAGQAHEYTQRAFKLADRLPLDHRYRVQATFYAARWETTDLAIEFFQEGLRLYPEEDDLRTTLARRYAFLERYEDAIEEFERLIAKGTTFTSTYFDTANAYAALGRFETGYRILSEFANRSPDSWYAQWCLGWHLTEGGKLEEAEGLFQRAAALRSAEPYLPYGRWRLQVLREDWGQADLEARKLAAFDDPFARWRGGVSLARNLLYQGRSEEALVWLEKAIGAYPKPNAFTALARCWKAELLLDRGEPARALEEARLAQEQGREDWPELKGLFLAALAQQDLDHPSAADAIAETLREKWQNHPNAVEERQLHHLDGLLALARGDAEAAVEALSRAAALLPAKGVEFSWHVYPDHVPIWSALGEAELEAGRDDDALHWFEQASASGSEHLEQPLPYVRSFYFLGHIQRRRGDADEARRSFERFLGYWGGGDLDRQRIERGLVPASGADSILAARLRPGLPDVVDESPASGVVE